MSLKSPSLCIDSDENEGRDKETGVLRNVKDEYLAEQMSFPCKVYEHS